MKKLLTIFQFLLELRKRFTITPEEANTRKEN